MTADDVMDKGRSLDPGVFDAVLFDLDGVITSTASVHAAAWKRLFDGYLRERADAAGAEFVPFDLDDDYRQYVDGKPRYEGVQSFLLSRGIDIPFGVPADPPDMETCCGLGNRKNQFFRGYLDERGAEVFPSSVELVKALRNKGVKTAVVSSSKNCEAILEKAGLTDLFDLRIDGVVAENENIPGKPRPDTFLEAAKRLNVDPKKAVVVEDAISGVEAGHAGGFGLVIGVDRTDDAEALAEHGADVVVKDLQEMLPLRDEKEEATE